MNSIKVFFIILFGLFGQNVYAQSDALLTSIPSLDVQKYLGRWYEISKFPNSFQKKCVAKTSAEYELNTDGSLRVLNQCQLADGEMNQAIGQAKQIGDSHSAKLEVRFAPIWLSFLPFVWGDYWVIDLDENYQLAAVSEPSKKYLWVLSRTPVVDEAKYSALLKRLTAMGLDVSRLEKSPQ